MFVFGDVVDPHPDVLKLVEDIVRNQVIEMVRSISVLSTIHFMLTSPVSYSNQKPWQLVALLDFSLQKI
jgi:hypothetical protein